MPGLVSLDIAECDDHDGSRRLTLTGELDLASAPQLRERMRELGRSHRTVRLDLSQLGFMDSTGIALIVWGLAVSKKDGWTLEVDPAVSEPVGRLITIVGLASQLWPPVERLNGEPSAQAI